MRPVTKGSDGSAVHLSRSLADTDPGVREALDDEVRRQRVQIELIASENVMSRAVREALGHEIGNKTLEGYPGNRFHGGGEHIDTVERLAIERAKELFGAAYANVQPHSGTQANQAVFFVLLRPGDRILSLDLAAGGHGATVRRASPGCASRPARVPLLSSASAPSGTGLRRSGRASAPGRAPWTVSGLRRSSRISRAGVQPFASWGSTTAQLDSRAEPPRGSGEAGVRLSTAQTICPRRTKKWLPQPLFLQIDGSRVTVPAK